MDESARTFDLYRLVVTCCVADSQSVGVQVIVPTRTAIPPRQWIRVAGVLRWDEAAASLVVQAATVAPIPVPAMPYL